MLNNAQLGFYRRFGNKANISIQPTLPQYLMSVIGKMLCSSKSKPTISMTEKLHSEYHISELGLHDVFSRFPLITSSDSPSST